MTNGVCNVDCSIRADEVAKLINRTVTVGNHVSTITNCNTSEKRINLADTSLTIETPGVIYDGDAGLGGATISNTLVFGKNAYGVIDIEGATFGPSLSPRAAPVPLILWIRSLLWAGRWMGLPLRFCSPYGWCALNTL